MIYGNLLLWAATVAALLSFFGYHAVAAGKKNLLTAARLSFYAMAIALTAATIALFYAFLTRQFGIEYVFNYSSNDLPLIYTISAFWAGQEGTFLLWAFMGAILGVIFLRKAREDEAHGMAMLGAIQIFTLVLMLKKSPFSPLPAEMLQKMGMGHGSPMDGAGLNPLLQDFWMAIHPPLIFLGYAALAIPFALALSALVRRDYDGWVARSLPWVAFAWAALGSGIFVGAYWAYKVLGWGGYWGWDPVENASLIPWLTCTALLHGMLTQRAVKGMRRANFGLAIASFLLVLYGTFLTRSGVLGDFSVHSFSDLGLNGFLVVFTLGFAAIGLGILFARWKDIPSAESNLYASSASREFAFLITVLVMSISAALVLVGTSSPLITTAMAKLHMVSKASKVDTPYYLWTNTPVGILLALLLTLCPLMAWRGSRIADYGRKARWPALFAALMAIAAVLTQTEQPTWVKAIMVVTVALGAFAVALNLMVLIPRLKGDKILSAGGYFAHLGFSLMLVGIIGSSGYSLHQRMDLARGETKTAFGYRFGLDQYATDPTNPGKATLGIQVETPNETFIAKPSLEENPRTGEVMQKPFIRKFPLSDLYISPQEYQPPANGNQFEVVKGQPAKDVGGYQVRFTKYEMSDHMGESVPSVGASIEVTKDGKTATLTPEWDVRTKVAKAPIKLFGGPATIQLDAIYPDRHSIGLSLSGPGMKSSAEIGVIEVSTKPLVNFVWLGTVLMVLGGCVAATRCARENRAAVATPARKIAPKHS